MHEVALIVLSGLLLLFSLAVVVAPNILHAAIALIASFLVTSAIYLQNGAEFAALAQIMIYIGGIVIFMVITVLLTSRLGEENIYFTPTWQRLTGVGVSAALLLVSFLIAARVYRARLVPTTIGPGAIADLDAIGLRLLRSDSEGLALPFELISVLLLISLIGAIVIARKEPAAGKGGAS